jgi:hypothetical protein
VLVSSLTRFVYERKDWAYEDVLSECPENFTPAQLAQRWEQVHRFLKACPEHGEREDWLQWYIAFHAGQISCSEHQLPPLSEELKGLTETMVHFAASGFQFLTVKEGAERVAICKACEFYSDAGRCFKCGCFISAKSRIAAAKCPVDKW